MVHACSTGKENKRKIFATKMAYSTTPLSQTPLKSDFPLIRTVYVGPLDFLTHYRQKYSAYVGHNLIRTFRLVGLLSLVPSGYRAPLKSDFSNFRTPVKSWSLSPT